MSIRILLLICLLVSISATGCSPSEKDVAKEKDAAKEIENKDPVKELESLAKSFQGKKIAWCLTGSDKRWGFFGQVDVVSVAYDVTKTDSLVSPFAGLITIEQRQWGAESGEFSSAEDAYKAPVRPPIPLSPQTAKYAWQDNTWVLQSVEAKGQTSINSKWTIRTVSAKDLSDINFERYFFEGLFGWPFMNPPVFDTQKIMEPRSLP